MTATGIRSLLAVAVAASFGLLGLNSSPMPAVSGARMVVSVPEIDALMKSQPGAWSQVRHRACLVTHAALGREEQVGDVRRVDCDRELMASR